MTSTNTSNIADGASVLAASRSDSPTACECCAAPTLKKYSRKRGHAIWKCESCGLAFVWPQPTIDQLKTLYAKDKGYFAAANTDLAVLSSQANQWLEDLIASIGIESGGREFLDVGCATGQLMFHMRSFGWNVRGFDVNADAVKIAARHDMDAKVSTIEDYPLPAGSIDVANLGDLIEHVPSPRTVFEKVYHGLKPGGLIVVRTPNNQSGYARTTAALSSLPGVSWGHSEAPYHLFEFSPRSVCTLLERVGFSIEQAQSAGSSRFVYRLGSSGAFDNLKSYMKRTGGYRISFRLLLNVPKLILVSAALYPCHVIGGWVSRFNQSGDSLLVVARKPVQTQGQLVGNP